MTCEYDRIRARNIAMLAKLREEAGLSGDKLKKLKEESKPASAKRRKPTFKAPVRQEAEKRQTRAGSRCGGGGGAGDVGEAKEEEDDPVPGRKKEEEEEEEEWVAGTSDEEEEEEEEKENAPPPPGKKTTTKKKAFKCEICGNGFTQKGSLKTHIQTIHEGQNFTCFCGKVFTQKGNLKKHIQTIHEGQNFTCFCGKVFTEKGSLTRHKLSAHEGKRFKCERCGNDYSDPSDLRRHFKKAHM